MHPPEERASDITAATPAAAAAWLAEHGLACWQRADAAALGAACAAVPDALLAQWPAVARWRALAAVLGESGEALACLELAHAGHSSAGDAQAAALDAHTALALCLADIGAMDAVGTWVQRSLGAPEPGPADAALLWWQAGRAARSVLEPAHPAGLALAWLHRGLQPLAGLLVPHERLLVAQVLVNAHFARQQHEQFDLIAATVMAPATFDAAPPTQRARWLHTLGFAFYQVGRHGDAQAAWQRGLDLAREHGLPQVGLTLTLALLRLALDRGELAAAARLEASVLPNWGAGRTTLLMELQQMRSRLLLLRAQPVQARAVLNEAFALAAHAGLSAPEQASMRTDEAQLLVALGELAAAQALLATLAQSHGGRDSAVFRCLGGLLLAWAAHTHDELRAREALASALHEARAIRYTMFLRLLPALAGRLCALALRWGVEVAFVTEVVRARDLPAPPDADAHWPWPVWLRLLGGFELRLHGQAQPRPAKPQGKPLELLRLLACEPDLSLPMRRAADALWPDADGGAAHKNLEVTVQRLRRLLDDETLVSVHESTLTLDGTRVSADLLHRRALGQRLQTLAMQAPPAAGPAGLAELRAAAELLRRWAASAPGPYAELLPGASDSAWLLARRTEVERDGERARNAMQALLLRATERRDGAALADAAAANEADALLRVLAQGLSGA